MQRDDDAIISKKPKLSRRASPNKDPEIMNRLLVTSLIFVCSYTFAHEPYVAPLAYKTEQTQVPVVAGYAEEALNSEYALKDAKLTVITPKQDPKVINAETLHKSVTVFDVPLPEDGTYILQTQASYPLKYVYDQKEWHLFLIYQQIKLRQKRA